MLDNIKKLVKDNQYKEANKQLVDLIKETDKNTELYSQATYLRGRLNTDFHYKDKSDFIAKQSFLDCIQSQYPLPQAYCEYANLEEDNNTAINYIKLGIEKFPNDPLLYRSLLQKTKTFKEKQNIIKQINELDIVDFYLYTNIINTYINNNSLEDCYSYCKKILAVYKLEDDEKLLYNLVLALSLIEIADEASLKEAEKILLKLIKDDVSNELHYVTYMGLIKIYLILNNTQKIIEYFDKIPFQGLQDYDNYPMLIYLDFEQLFTEILNKLDKLFTKDRQRKQKTKILLAMYFCKREYYFEGVDRIQKKHIAILVKAFKDYPKELKIGKYLFSAQVKLKLNYDAYLTAIEMYKSESTFLNHISFESILDKIEGYDLCNIITDLLNSMQTFYISEIFVNRILDPIIRHIYESDDDNKYRNICRIAKNIDSEAISYSNCKFEMAYSYEELEDHKKAEKLYKMELKKTPNSSAVLNNLGVIYKNNHEYEKAIQYFEKGIKADPNNEKCPMNLKESKEKFIKQKNKIYENLSKNVNIEFFENIGYNDDLKCLLNNINDSELKDLLVSDLEESAICIATKQNKSATILCGSIVEAVLMDTLLNRNIKKYTIKNKSKNIKDMSLNELLEVANSEKIISKITYNLSHVIKDYRNIIHPSNSIRNSFKISDERVMVIWNILKEILESLLN